MNITDGWIQHLTNTSAYPHPVNEIQLLETHISWVILTGEYAYKIKKPLNLGFLDFSTLEKRRHYCEEEFRLNLRLAPALYLGVVPIGGSPSLPHIGCQTGVFEYAVRMHQFPQHAMLEQVLERGELRTEQISQLAADIAVFHDQVTRASSESDFGSLAAIEQPMLENFAQISSLLDKNDDKELLNRIRLLSIDEFHRHQEEFTTRKQQGFIRECHGDIHIGNMVLLDQRIILFDCIEFNPNLFWIDTISDIAFPVMDLEQRQQPQLASLLLNCYLELSGDYKGLSLLRHYQAYRAMVRAKVAGIRAQQVESGHPVHQQAMTEARRYMHLAQHYLEVRKPHLIITHGLSGSGKTTATTDLLQNIAAIRLRSDVERKRLFGLSQQEKTGARINQGIYQPSTTDQTYQHLHDLTKILLSAGFAVIVDATFLQKRHRELFRSLANTTGSLFHILHFEATEEVLKRNILQRQTLNQDASDADLAVLNNQITHYQPLENDEYTNTITITPDMDNEVKSMIYQRLR